MPKAFTQTQVMAFDGFMIANKSNGLALHCMARAISRFFSFRNHDICLTGPDGRPTVDYNPRQIVEVAKLTYDQMSRLRLTAARSPRFGFKRQTDHFVAIGDSVKVISKIPAQLITDATVYADPAWPYSKQFGSANPYRFAYRMAVIDDAATAVDAQGAWEIDDKDQDVSDVTTRSPRPLSMTPSSLSSVRKTPTFPANERSGMADHARSALAVKTPPAVCRHQLVLKPQIPYILVLPEPTIMSAPSPDGTDFSQYLTDAGYYLPIPVAGGRWLALQQQLYTVGLYVINDGDMVGWRCRFCYGRPAGFGRAVYLGRSRRRSAGALGQAKRPRQPRPAGRPA